MVFSSLIFLFAFLPITLGLYYAAHRWGPWRLKHLVLTLLSYVFYGWSNPLFMPLMLLSTFIDYACGLTVSGGWRGIGDPPQLPRGGERTRTQRIALVTSVISNLSLLAFFKYWNFGLDSWNALAHALGMHSAAYDHFLRIALPLGISFYTFQSMSYAIDIYRGDARAVRSFTDFACYVAMYPQLVAGPIIRYQEVDRQMRDRTHTLDKFARGVAFVALGLGKKVLLADPCGAVADPCFAAGSLGMTESWIGIIAYAFQIYFDFSAYSDMAVGLGLMLGFTFAKNFDSPYLSASITEFWRRWHLSLSTWLRDYLYIPLGGNRRGERRTYANLAMVMLLGGLWHGASWNFVVWGGIHGVMLGAERAMGKRSWYAALPHPARVVLTFAITCIAWVFFRADDLPGALAYCAALVGLGEGGASSALATAGVSSYHLLSVVASGAVVWFAPQAWDITRTITWPKIAGICATLAIGVILLAATSYHPFIYFIF